MNRSNSLNISELDRIWGGKIQIVKNGASNTLVTGQEFVDVLEEVDPSRLVAGCLPSYTLVGLVRAKPAVNVGVTQDEYFTPYAELLGDELISLVYLVENEAAQSLMLNSLPHGILAKAGVFFNDYIRSHPFALFVEGRTDINIAKAFASKEEALEYLQTTSTIEGMVADNMYVSSDIVDFLKSNSESNPTPLAENMLFYTF